MLVDQMKSYRLQKLVEHCRRFGFVTEKFKTSESAYFPESISSEKDTHNRLKNSTDVDVKTVTYEYGSFGSLMRRNVIDQWWKHSVTFQDRVFPLFFLGRNDLDIENAVARHYAFIPRIKAQENYEKLTKEVLCKELGVAQVATQPSCNNTDSFIARSPFVEYLTVHHFCPIKKGSTIFNELIKQRLRWWKRFSNKQSNFAHLVKETDSNVTTAEISYSCSFGRETVETIHLGIKDDNDKVWQNNKSVIECCTTVEQAMLAYLDDGLEERMQEDEDDTASQNILRLHPNLAPIKVIILAEDPSNEEQLDLVNRLAKELKIAGIPCHKLFLHNEQDAYNFADAIGTPFSLKIDQHTLQRGVVGLRHRDTTVHEFLHIAETRETLTKILRS